MNEILNFKVRKMLKLEGKVRRFGIWS